MLKITINNKQIEVENGKSILQIADGLGIEIPRFCYHPSLSIAGNCRMCLVEIEGMPKLATACSTFPSDGMVIYTDNERVKKAREGVLEFLLINHPLDCPICDQGGECDLQDVFMKYGKQKSEFNEGKRKIAPYALSEYIMFYPERCIHCMRCVRFATEIAGIEEIGAIGRGEDTRITTALDGVIESELSGNIIDLCPVGALTERPFQYKARCWELTKTDSIDMTDGLGTPISLHIKDNEILRIKPKSGWLTDKARFAYLTINDNRLRSPMVRKNGELEEVSWDEAIKTVAAKLKQENTVVLAGENTSLENAKALEILSKYLDSDNADVIYALNTDVEIPEGKFLIYQGSYNTETAQNADIILPSANYVEEQGSYVNTEGKKQSVAKAINPPASIKENWKIIHEITIAIGKNPEYASFKQLEKMI